MTTRPRRRAPGAAASCSHPPASPTPPTQARGLMQAGFPIGPTPGGAASSTATSTTAARSPAVGTSTDDPDATAVAAAMTAVAAATSCGGSVAIATSRGDSLTAAALVTARGTLDERRLVGMDTPDLSALAGARAGMIDVTLQMGKHKYCLPQVGEAPLPLPQGFGGRRCGSSTDGPVAGASVPATGACSMATSAARSDGGEGLHLSGGLAPHRSPPPPPPPPPTMSSPASPGGGGGSESLLLAQPVLLTLLLPALPPPDSPLLRARRPLRFPSLRRAGGCPGPGRQRIRSRGVHGHPLLITTIKTTPVRCKRPKGKGKPTHRRGIREHDE
jgi:hypothetical protein